MKIVKRPQRPKEPRNIAEAGSVGRTVQSAVADGFTRNLLPVINARRSTDAVALEAISCGLEPAERRESAERTVLDIPLR